MKYKIQLLLAIIFFSVMLNCNITKILKGADKNLLKVCLVIVNLRKFGGTLIILSSFLKNERVILSHQASKSNAHT